MIPMLYRYVGGAVVVLALFGGTYLAGRSNGKEVVQKELDAQRATWQTQYDAQVAKTAAKEQDADLRLKDTVAEYEKRLQDSQSSISGLSRRLRLATCPGIGPLPGNPALASGDSGTGEPDGGIAEIERDSDAAWSAAIRAAAALTGCQKAYTSVREAFNRGT